MNTKVPHFALYTYFLKALVGTLGDRLIPLCISSWQSLRSSCIVGLKISFSMPIFSIHQSAAGHAETADGSYKYLCVCLWLKCWLRTFALTYSYNCISWSGSGHEITPPSHDTDAGALLQASYKSFSLQVTRTTVQVSSIQIVGIQTDWKRQKLWILQIRGRVVEQHASPDHDMSLWVRGRERHCRFCAADSVRSGLHWLHFS